jgi:pilus assembly protein Flp/PilA
VDQSQQHQGIKLRGIDPMSRLRASVKRFLVSEDGPTAVEYAVMLALIIVVCLAAVSTVGSNANSRFNKVRTYLS